MHRDLAFAAFYRLATHFPSLAGEEGDQFAEDRTNDWVGFLARYDEATVEEALALLVKNWTKDRYPRIGDFQEIARTIAARPDSRQLERATSGPEATYLCPGGCRDTGLVEYTSGLFDVGTDGRQSYHEASEDRPVMARCPVCNGGVHPRRIPQDAIGNIPSRVPRGVGLAGVGAAKTVLETLAGYKSSGVLPPRRSTGNAGSPAPMLTYAQVYDEAGNPRAEHAEETARITRLAAARIPEDTADPAPLSGALARVVAGMEHDTLPS